MGSSSGTSIRFHHLYLDTLFPGLSTSSRICSHLAEGKSAEAMEKVKVKVMESR